MSINLWRHTCMTGLTDPSPSPSPLPPTELCVNLWSHNEEHTPDLSIVCGDGIICLVNVLCCRQSGCLRYTVWTSLQSGWMRWTKMVCTQLLCLPPSSLAPSTFLSVTTMSCGGAVYVHLWDPSFLHPFFLSPLPPLSLSPLPPLSLLFSPPCFSLLPSLLFSAFLPPLLSSLPALSCRAGYNVPIPGRPD